MTRFFIPLSLDCTAIPAFLTKVCMCLAIAQMTVVVGSRVIFPSWLFCLSLLACTFHTLLDTPSYLMYEVTEYSGPSVIRMLTSSPPFLVIRISEESVIIELRT